MLIMHSLLDREESFSWITSEKILADNFGIEKIGLGS